MERIKCGGMLFAISTISTCMNLNVVYVVAFAKRLFLSSSFLPEFYFRVLVLTKKS